MLQFGAERENRPSLLLRLPSGGGQYQTPPHPVEQCHPEGLLQLGDLTTDGLRREVQLFGGLGVVSEQPVERLYREIRALRIYEGATEVQQLIIGKSVLRNGGLS